MQWDERWDVPIAARGSGVVVLNAQREVLLVREGKAGMEDLWHIPSGTVEPGENPQDAAVREAYEETGLRVRLLRFLNAHIGRLPDGAFVVRMAWLAEATDETPPAPVFTQEVREARYLSRAEFEALYTAGKIRMYHTRLFIDAAYSETD
ncbi:Nudix hydrolase [Deinococcus ruber]|uniref:DNA mismatch repair protein MutT n=1 Tax=Deinococcus ruber TaxID=1848197 RepID=A0A918F724_9DEIO|nr:Nudix hydrolase [Deinococcus ruber]GGR14820.1 DNA mismatch repair protein MutT [Deinococcus ruber]